MRVRHRGRHNYLLIDYNPGTPGKPDGTAKVVEIPTGRVAEVG